MANRGFSADNIPEKLADYHGGCVCASLSPALNPEIVPSVNMNLTLDEALRLSTALQSAILRLNRYNRSTTKGKSVGIGLSLKIKTGALAVIEKPVKPPKGRSAE